MDNFKPSIIDVVVLVDAPRIVYDYGANKAKDNVTFSDYVQLGPKGEGVGYVYMVTTWWDAKGEGGSELSIFGSVGNKIRWRMRTLSMGGRADSASNSEEPVAYQVSIKGFVINQGREYITPPVKKTEIVESWDFDQNGELISKTVIDVYWESEVIRPGFGNEVVYHIPFNILCSCQECNDNGGGGGGGGGGCGGYTYDPFIVTN